jgi:hypothetical protein
VADIDTVYIKVRPDLAGFETDASRGLRHSGEKAGKQFGTAFGGSFKRQVAGIAGGFLLAGGIQASLTSGIRLIKDLGNAAKEEESRTVLLATSIKNLGTETTLFGRTLDDVIEKESRTKGFTDTQLTDAFIRLNTVTKDSARAFHDLQLAEDISRQRKIGVTQAALLLARAESGVFTSIRRLGLAVPALTKEETKLSKERQKRILTTRLFTSLEEKFGGTAVAVAQTATGATDRLGVAFSELEEDLGTALLPSITAVASGISDFLGKEENQARVQRDVNEAVRIGGEVFRGLANGFQATRAVAEPLVNLVGGLDDAVRLLLTAMAVGKVAAFAGVLRLVGPAAGVATAGLVTTEAAATGVGVASVTSASRVNLLRANLLRLGAVGAIAIGVDAFFRYKADEGLKINADQSAALAEGRVTPEAIKKLLEDQGKGGFVGKAAQEILARLTPISNRLDSIESLRNTPEYFVAASGAVTTSPAVAAAAAPAPPTADQARLIAVAKAKTTAGTVDEEALYRSQLAYVNRQVSRLERDNSLTKAERNRLVRLYDTKAQLQDELGGIEAERQSLAEEAARKRKELADERKRIAEENKRIAEERRSAAEEASGLIKEEFARIRQAAKDRRQRFQSLKEQRLQLRTQEAQLTKTNADDLKAQRALVTYYGKQEIRLREAGALAESVAARSNKIAAQLAIKGIKSEKKKATEPGFSPAQFFGEAIKNFQAFGSNIAGEGGILSGQEARGAFAGLALAKAAPDRAAQILAVNSSSSLTEQQKQTRILGIIATSLRREGRPSSQGQRGGDGATRRTREQAAMQSLGGHGAI